MFNVLLKSVDNCWKLAVFLLDLSVDPLRILRPSLTPCAVDRRTAFMQNLARLLGRFDQLLKVALPKCSLHICR